MSFRTRYRRYGLGLLTVVLTAVPAAAAELASYSGADREARLIAGAQKEGQLNLYAVMGLEQMQVIAAAFEKKYGLKVSIWRASSETTLRREGLLAPVRSPFAADLIAQAVPAHGEWIGARINIFVQAYHTGKVRDPAAVLDENPKWQRLYDQIVVRQEPS